MTATSGGARAAFRELPRLLRAYIVVVTAAYVVVTCWLGTEYDFELHHLALLAFLVLCGIVVSETSRGFLRGLAKGFSQDLNSCWKLPVVLLLPPFVAALAPILFVNYWSWSARRRTTIYRQVFSMSAIGLCDAVASLLFHHLVADGASPATFVGGALLAAVVGRICNMVLLAGAVRLDQPDALRHIVNRETLLYLGVEACVGIVVALLVQQGMLLALLAIPPVILLHRSLLHEQLRTASRTDAKTAVLNAGAWEHDALAEMDRARGRQSTSVLICDIDHFKRVNDAHGHLAGDAALRAVAQRLQGQLRQSDILGRFGGEEFVILLAASDRIAARAIAERLRHAVGADPVLLDRSAITLTVSLGVATADRSEGKLADVLAAADEALYAAKRRGRDRVVVARRLRAADDGSRPAVALEDVPREEHRTDVPDGLAR